MSTVFVNVSSHFLHLDIMQKTRDPRTPMSVTLESSHDLRKKVCKMLLHITEIAIEAMQNNSVFFRYSGKDFVSRWS